MWPQRIGHDWATFTSFHLNGSFGAKLNGFWRLRCGENTHTHTHTIHTVTFYKGTQVANSLAIRLITSPYSECVHAALKFKNNQS